MSPKIKFVNLHGHSCASIFDGFGWPKDHIDFAIENGLDGLAITDHGNMNNLVYQVMYTKELHKKGVPFKSVYGVEAYHISSIEKWEEERQKTDAKDEGSSIVVEDEETKSEMTSINKRSHLVLLAKNQKGLNNIFKLISDSYKRPNYFRFPRVDYEMLRKHSEGVLATSACCGGVLAAAYWERREQGLQAVVEGMDEVNKEFKSIFGDDWYGEIQFNGLPDQHEINKCVMESCAKFGIEVVATADAHYPRPELWKDREMYKRLGWKSSSENPLPDDVEEMGYKLYPKNGDEMFKDYKKYAKDCNVEHYYNDDFVIEAIERTHFIAHKKIDSFFPENEVRMPNFLFKDHEDTPEKELVKKAFDALKQKGLTSEKYIERLTHELQTINRRGFAKYFLTMTEIVKVARNEMHILVGGGRGSAAGSLTAYLLGITEIDSVKWGTQFERFLLEEDTSYPDIDVDYSDAFGLKEYLISKWGVDNVVPISNFNTLKPKSLVKDISKFFNIEFAEVNEVTSKMILEATPPAKAKHGITSGVYDPTYEEIKEFSTSYSNFLAKYPFIESHIEAILNHPRSISRHAGGVIIGENLSTQMPLITARSKTNGEEVVQTPWSEGQNVRQLEPMGFIKFDLLGLQTLSDFEECIFNILKRHEGVPNPTRDQMVDWYNKNLHADSINFNDPEVYKVFKNGDFLNTFQFAEAAAQGYCQEISPDNIIEISTITSIQRPGPLGAGVDKGYAEAKKDPSKVKYLNDVHKEVTENTYGFLVFQEQIALLAHKLGKNITLNEGNYLRKILTKKGTGAKSEALEKIYEKFLEGCLEKGMTKEETETLFDTMENFARYGFNFSHALAYSILSYQCAFLYTYYPECWCAAVLTNENPVKAKTITQVKARGFTIKPPSILNSTNKWEISKDGSTLYQPLTSVQGIGEAAYEAILKNRPYNNIEELLFIPSVKFFKKKDPEIKDKPRPKIDKKVLDILTRCGAMDELIDSRFANRKHFWAIVAASRPKTREELDAMLEDEEIRNMPDFTKEEYINFRVELTKSYPLDDIIPQAYFDAFESKNIIPAAEWNEEHDGKYWFLVFEKNKRKTKTGKEYWEISIIDSTYNQNKLKIWWLADGDAFEINHLYIADNLVYDEKWGFSFGRDKKVKDSFSEVRLPKA